MSYRVLDRALFCLKKARRRGSKRKVSLVLLNVLAVVMESVSSIFTRYELYFYYFEILSVAIFSVEYFLRLWANGAIRYETRIGISNGSLRYALSFHGVIDLIAILPFYLQMLLPGLDCQSSDLCESLNYRTIQQRLKIYSVRSGKNADHSPLRLTSFCSP